MNLGVRVAAAGLGLLLLGWFAYAHFDQAVDLRFGLFTLRDVPLPVVIYLAVIIGMLAIVAVGLRGDRGRRRAGEGAGSGSSSEPSRSREEPSGMTSR